MFVILEQISIFGFFEEVKVFSGRTKILNGDVFCRDASEWYLCGLLILWRQGCESTLNFAKNQQIFGLKIGIHGAAGCIILQHCSETLILGSFVFFDAVFDQHKLGGPPAVGRPFRTSLKST